MEELGKDSRFGRMLVDEGLASEPAVRAALAEQERELALGRTPDRLGEILVKRGHIRPEAVLRAL
ncbi:MAG: hypothetical protein HZA54_12460, partial [Planctomycetes bacterium]|nr:hypothetical protein [Planctomycetota bacterium]